MAERQRGEQGCKGNDQEQRWTGDSHDPWHSFQPRRANWASAPHRMLALTTDGDAGREADIPVERRSEDYFAAALSLLPALTFTP